MASLLKVMPTDHEGCGYIVRTDHCQKLLPKVKKSGMNRCSDGIRVVSSTSTPGEKNEISPFGHHSPVVQSLL